MAFANDAANMTPKNRTVAVVGASLRRARCTNTNLGWVTLC